MQNQIFEKRVHLNHSPETVFGWHERDGAFERLSPPWMDVDCQERTGGIKDGARVVLNVHKGPVHIRWELCHKDYVVNRQFVDYQISGPFESWQQLHLVTAEEGGCSLTDRAEYRMPMGLAGQLCAAEIIRADLSRLFRYRHSLMRRDLALHTKYGARPLKILVSGGSGLIGSHLIPFLTTQGHSVVQLVRSKSNSKTGSPALGEGGRQIVWDPDNGTIDGPLPEGLDGAVHLGGYNVAAKPWSPEVKVAIEESRLKSTAYLVKLFTETKNPPKVFVCASAMDFYGDTGSTAVTEDSPAGKGFLAELCQRWEEAANAASLNSGPGMRVVNLRIAGVLSPKGGVLAKLLPTFQAGGGGFAGDGKQYSSWISMDDMLGCIYHCLVNEAVNGPLNAVAPESVTNKQFASTLGHVLSRPVLFSMPAPIVRVAFGEMGEALLLASRKLLPQKLQQTGYEFLDPELGEALKYMLGLSAGYEG